MFHRSLGISMLKYFVQHADHKSRYIVKLLSVEARVQETARMNGHVNMVHKCLLTKVVFIPQE